MSGAAGWAALAGFAQGLGSELKERDDFERKQKLYQMEQDVMLQREKTLATLRAELQDENAGKRSDRAIDRMTYKDQLESGNIVGQFKDPETGSMYGRTKKGDVVPLNITSDEYQDAEKRLHGAKATTAEMQPERTQAEIDRAQASTANINSMKDRREATPIADPAGDKIRSDYQKQINARRVQAIKDAQAAAKAGGKGAPFDENQAAQDVTSQLYSVYGADAVGKALGGARNTASPVNTSMPGTQAGASTTAPPQQGNVPTPEALMAQASAAVKARPDKQAEIEARLKQLMVKYGYQPQ